MCRGHVLSGHDVALGSFLYGCRIRGVGLRCLLGSSFCRCLGLGGFLGHNLDSGSFCGGRLHFGGFLDRSLDGFLCLLGGGFGLRLLDRARLYGIFRCNLCGRLFLCGGLLDDLGVGGQVLGCPSLLLSLRDNLVGVGVLRDVRIELHCTSFRIRGRTTFNVNQWAYILHLTGKKRTQRR